MPNLVKIEGNKYSFYEGIEKVISIASDEPVEADWLEFYRKVPKLLKEQLETPLQYTLEF